MLKALRARLAALVAERDQRLAELTEIRDKMTAEARADFGEDEASAWKSARERVKEIDTEIRGDAKTGEPAAEGSLEARIAELEELEERQKASAAIAAAADAGKGARTPGSGVKVGEEPLTYMKGKRSSRFFADAFAAVKRGDVGAQDRIARHSREMDHVYAEYRSDDREARATTTANYAGLVIPQYLVEEFAEVARAGRPFLNVVRNAPLPDEGMTVNIGLGTTGTSAAAQATQNSAVSETNYDDTLLTVDVRTYAGQQTISRQALERGTLVDAIIAEDLLSAYMTALDAGAIASDGTSGTHKGILSATGINAVTYTDATPTVGELYPKIADAAWNQVPANVFRGVDALFLHPRRFAWILGAVDSQGRPLAVPDVAGAMNAMAAGGSGPAYGPTGYRIQGVPAYTDANIPANLGAGTNEDRIIAVASREVILWEDPAAPIQLRFDEPLAASLGVLFVAYGYSAFTAERRPKATSVISGTGLVTPTF